jgi:hypothetical protein
MNRAAFVLSVGTLLFLVIPACDKDERAQITHSQARVAEASRQLVEADAKARGEIIAMQKGLQQGQSELGRQRDQLEDDRRQYADQRSRDPLLLANTILDVGMIVACLLPMVLGIVLAIGLRDTSRTDADVADILIQEIVSEEPRLLSQPHMTAALPKEPPDRETIWKV